MTDLEWDASEAPLVTGVELAAASTPLRRAAGRLEKALPPGWRVEVVDARQRPGPEDTAALRVVMPDN
ncbi:hypothetical protein SAMN04244553_4501 [Nocardia amikacinitolerans]|uniref:Uncharacterized protein n=1 Tax=Nocardia amikacinitolerans TaxID=756689 RepID=A0A285LSY2_9NOCA|nr:hypothetical protein [Nocardia amikacinitolerans]MCP2276491.1 hypothetical protein [Nocardia amikacinitolerans]MCP2295126.1 hypothetical protein [Nocardia amikacinitolerans]MCP2319407.1 hypothetical protein [Nocardia amikacinitolerans]SNY87553.1 hypothetical protein SAMN04244553_4501 [Nocardia amikacinitolerans]